MSRNNLFLIALLVIPFVLFFVRPDLLGVDSYAYGLQLCGVRDFSNLAGFFVFSWLPCNILAWKALLFGAYVISLIGLWFLARQNADKNTSLKTLVLLAGLSPLLLFTFFKFENEAIALPLIIWGTMLFYSTINKKNNFSNPKMIIAFALFIAAGFVWNGTTYFLLALGAAYIPALIMVGTIYLTKTKEFMNHLLPQVTAIESTIGGLSMLLFLVVPVFFVSKKWRDTAPLFVALIISILNPKLLIISIPFFVKPLNNMQALLKAKPTLNASVLSFTAILLLGWGVSSFIQIPTQNHWEAIDATLDLNTDFGYRLENDWSYGYWLQWRGGDTESFGGGSDPDYNSIERPFVAMTMQELDCDKNFFARGLHENINVYICR